MRKHYLLLSRMFEINGFIEKEKFETYGSLVFDKNKKQIWMKVRLPDDKLLSIPLMPIKFPLISMFKLMELKDEKEIFIEIGRDDLYHQEVDE